MPIYPNVKKKCIVLAPDSFKGTLPALKVAQTMAIGIRRVWPHADLRLHPMADGGEGTLDAIAAGSSVFWRRCRVNDLEGKPIPVRWLSLRDGTVVLESAEVVGIDRITRSTIELRSTAGLGELIRVALDTRCRRILIGLGGTGTSDGGAGLLTALGARLLDAKGRVISADLAGLAKLASLDLSGIDPRLRETELTILADVESPLTGPTGATMMFGPQKGMASTEIKRFDSYLAHLGHLGDVAVGKAYSAEPGSGAAGGLGWALKLLGAGMTAGAELVANLQNLDASLANASWVLTGEGRSDAQTVLGKVPWRVAARAARFGVPVVLLSGSVAQDILPLFRTRFTRCLALSDGAISISEARHHAVRLLAERSEAWARQCLQRSPG